MSKARTEVSFADWRSAAKARYSSADGIAFMCPACHHRQTVAACRAAGMPENMIGFSCIGRVLPNKRSAFEGKGPGPCNYAGGGLFALNPVRVLMDDGTHTDVMDFADRPLAQKVA